MKSLIFLSIIVIPVLEANELPALIDPTDKWSAITAGEPTITQLLIQYDAEFGGLHRLTSQKTETFSSYTEFRLTAAKKALSLVNLFRQPIYSSINPVWPETLRLQLKTKVGAVEKFAIDVNMDNPKDITLETILLLFPNTLGSILTIPEMTGLTLEIGENPPTAIIVPVNAGVAVLDNIPPYPNQRIRYHITFGEGDNARTGIYTQHGTKISPPEISMTHFVFDHDDWWWDEEGVLSTQYYYEVRVSYSRGVDITLESSSDTTLWNIVDSRLWNTETTSMESWFNVTNQPRLFFRAHAK